VLRFSTTPTELVGSTSVEGVSVVGGPDSEPEVIETGLVLRSVGYRGSEIDGLPFDPARCIVPNEAGRVTDRGQPVAAVYVTGWIKCGAQGVIGTNRTCAEETVGQLIRDRKDGRLRSAVGSNADLDALLSARNVTVVDWNGWQSIDAAERSRGTESSRPRIKLVAVDQLLTAASGV
jgi:ferredoxin--NADP+ reductase